MSLLLSLLGILVAGWILFKYNKSYPGILFLSLYLFLVSLYFLNMYVLFNSESIFYNSLISSNLTFAYYLIGPFAFFYVRSVIKDSSKLNTLDYLHFIPALVFLIALIPYYLTPYAHKVAVARQIVADPDFLITFKPTILSEWFSVRWVYLSRPISLFIYLLLSLRLFLPSLRSVRIKGNAQNQLIHKWLLFFFAFQLLFVLSHWINITDSFDQKNTHLITTETLVNFIFSIGYLGIMASPLLFVNIVYGIPKMQSDSNYNHEVAAAPTLLKDAYHPSGDLLTNLDLLIEDHFATHMPYLNHHFNLSHLSVELKVPEHHLAYYFRVKCAENFTEYRNRHRVQYAKALIEQNTLENKTFQIIGEQAGFSSLNTFYRVFKNQTGLSPGEYQQKRATEH